MSSETPTDPALLRAEIAKTRADLGDTVAALAAKTDVKARAKDAIEQAKTQATQKVRAVRGQAAETAENVRGQATGVAGSLTDRVKSGANSVRGSVNDVDLPSAAAKPVRISAIAVAAALVGLVIYLVRRRRS